MDPGNSGGSGSGGVLVDDRIKSKASSDGNDGSSSTVGWILIPVIVVSLSGVIISVVLIMRGLCCKCCYSNFKGLQKYEKQPDGSPDKASNGQSSASLPQQSSSKKGDANYASMNKNKNGKKNEFEGANNVSVLNFDITGDVTRELTDVEGVQQTQANQAPYNRNLPQTAANKQSGRNLREHRNSTASNFIDPMTQASNREKIYLTQGQDDELNRKADLEDHTRKASNLTYPQGQALEEVKEDSLHSYQFSGSQFGAPSDAAQQ